MGSTPHAHDAAHAHGPDDEDPTVGLSRRDFLRLGGALAAATAMTSVGCQMPAEELVPFNDRPEDANVLGKARFFTTVVDDVPVLARCRDGRPILITPHGGHPSGRGFTVRSQAALLDLYDPDRASKPLSIRRGKGAPVESSWQAIGAALVAALAAQQGDTVLVTGQLTGPATRRAIEELVQAGKLRHLTYVPLGNDGATLAWQAAFGARPMPRPRLDHASLIVGFGAELMDRPANGLERDFAVGRDPANALTMSRFVQFEGRLTLTGANADRRFRVRDSQLVSVAAAIAYEIIITQKTGPLAGNPDVEKALRPFAPDSVAKTTGVDAAVLAGLARELTGAAGKAIALAGGSASFSASGPGLELATLLINVSLGAYESPVHDLDVATRMTAGELAALGELTEQMRAGTIGTLVLAGVNPVYDAPTSLGFAEALSHVGLVVALADRVDETAALADWLAPLSHPFEAWGDSSLGAGIGAIQQPLIRPLQDSMGVLDVLVSWGAALGVGGRIADAAAKSTAAPGPAASAGAPGTRAGLSAAYHYLRAFWAGLLRLPADTPEFEEAWAEMLRTGVATGPVTPPLRFDLAPDALALLQPPAAPPALELQLYPHFALEDGRSANNGWLLELPDPITRITWDGAVSIAPRRFDELGLTNGDLVEVTTDAGKLVLPAYRHAGMHPDQLAIALGQGRTRAGLVGGDVGVNAFALQGMVDGRAKRSGLEAQLRKVGGNRPLAIFQGSEVIDRERRPIVPVTTLTEYAKDPKAGTEQPPSGPSAWPGHEYEGHRWAMAIDLSRCNGCGKCVLGCQAENNIPVVGAEGIRRGRGMAWIRIDRYYDAPKRPGGRGAETWDGPLDVVEEPLTLFEPMLCQHCENAPCETVCPVAATVHSSDGLNQQIYNRCVGTRYCANNCPFKVRRFNWWEYSVARSSTLLRLLFPDLERNATLNARGRMALKNNPEVTVRTRGVMEKCSFCVQRIREARAEAIRQGHKNELPDGSVVPACMEACPTGAIVFGNVNDPAARVHALIHGPRAMRLLEATGVAPAISYLTRVRNDNA